MISNIWLKIERSSRNRRYTRCYSFR